MELKFFFSAHRLMVVYCIQSFMKIFSMVLVIERTQFSLGKISKGHNSVKLYMELLFFFSEHRLMMVYICTKFMKYSRRY